MQKGNSLTKILSPMGGAPPLLSPLNPPLIEATRFHGVGGQWSPLKVTDSHAVNMHDALRSLSV